MSNENIIFDNIFKIFPPNNIALNGVTVTIKKGTIHSIVGENGAGKSTLMKILYGLEHQNYGNVYIGEEKLDVKSPIDVIPYGIGMVHQEFMLIPEFAVLDNIILGVEPTKRGLIHKGFALDRIDEILKSINFNIDYNKKIKDISIAAQQKVEIVKQLYRNVDTLILDEPTAVLTPQETDELFELLRTLKTAGKTIIFISHKLDEVLKISDSITVMRKGEHIWTKPNCGLTKTDLANAMVGREVLFNLEKTSLQPGRAVLKIENLCEKDTSRKNPLKNINLEVHSYEIVGIAGVEGNGQYELVNILSKEISYTGEIHILDVDLGRMTTHEKRKHFAYVPQDRKTMGSSQEQNIIENVLMTHHYINHSFVAPGGILRKHSIKEFAKKILSQYQVNTDDCMKEIGALSGGNQQKVIIGREFELDSPLLIIDQPVRGLDVGSIEYVHKEILKKREAGVAILLFSADLDELFNLTDRIAVMLDGRIVKVLDTAQTTREEVGAYMLGAVS